MLSLISPEGSLRRSAIPFGVALCAAAFAPTPAQSQVLTGVGGGGGYVCQIGGTIYTVPSSTDCTDTGSFDAADGLLTGNATFSDPFNSAVFSGGTVSFNSVTTAFGGGSTTFNNTVSFTGSSVTFSTPTTFQNPATFNGTTNFTAGMTTTNITNSGGISTGTLNVSSGLTAAAGANVNMGGNIIHGVAAGVAATDAVNVAQLVAATSGITADVTELEAIADTHTTQISELQSTTATHSTQIANLETTTATHTTQITSLQSDVSTLDTTTATHTTQITNLQTGLTATNSDVADLQTGLASETAARIAADSAFDGRIDALEAVTANLNERFDDVEDRADAGTATAVALSGAMFLPGKSFNLTANVGAYRGAVAGALQIGALVSDSVAVNAGVAHGFNKGGKTAMRAGFTLGW